jgi:hypothetical protein
MIIRKIPMEENAKHLFSQNDFKYLPLPIVSLSRYMKLEKSETLGTNG